MSRAGDRLGRCVLCGAPCDGRTCRAHDGIEVDAVPADPLESLPMQAAETLEDGYNTTITLDCGCEIRLNLDERHTFKEGDYFACQRHSAPYGYDPQYGTPLVDRDRRVTEIRSTPCAQAATGTEPC